MTNKKATKTKGGMESQAQTAGGVSASELIANQLKEEIRRHWKVGDRVPPIKELSKLLGTGQTNTHAAAKLLADQGWLEANPRRGTFVKRIPAEEQGPVVVRTRARRVTLLRYEGMYEGFIGLAQEAAEARLAQAGLEVSVMKMGFKGKPENPDRVSQADGVVIIQPARINELVILEKQAAVLMSTAINGGTLLAGHDVVSVDSEQGGALAGQMLAERGFGAVAFLGVWPVKHQERFDEISQTRLRGFEMGMGSCVDRGHYLFADAHRAEEGAKQFASYLAMPNRPEVVFCACDDLAVGFAYGGYAHGMEPGRDYHLVGFDGQNRGRDLLGGPLTSVVAPLEAMGRLAAEVLISRLVSPGAPARRVLLPCSLFAGNTVREPGLGTVKV